MRTVHQTQITIKPQRRKTSSPPASQSEMRRRIQSRSKFELRVQMSKEFYRGSLPISAKATAAPQVPVTTNAATHVRRARVSPCTLCGQLGHRRERCPNFPCRLCNIKGHGGRDCPARPEEPHERRKITCSHCKQQGHRRQMCPNAPCKYCNVIGHLGKLSSQGRGASQPEEGRFSEGKPIMEG